MYGGSIRIRFRAVTAAIDTGRTRRHDPRPRSGFCDRQHVAFRILTSIRLIGDVTLNVEKGIQNLAGHELQEASSEVVHFEEVIPNIRLVGKGVIIPRSSMLPFEFMAVNLSAVDVRIIEIYEKSVPQFLQVNRLDGSSELRRVGHVMLKKKVSLNKNKNGKKFLHSI